MAGGGGGRNPDGVLGIRRGVCLCGGAGEPCWLVCGVPTSAIGAFDKAGVLGTSAGALDANMGVPSVGPGMTASYGTSTSFGPIDGNEDDGIGKG